MTTNIDKPALSIFEAAEQRFNSAHQQVTKALSARINDQFENHLSDSISAAMCSEDVAAIKAIQGQMQSDFANRQALLGQRLSEAMQQIALREVQLSDLSVQAAHEPTNNPEKTTDGDEKNAS